MFLSLLLFNPLQKSHHLSSRTPKCLSIRPSLSQPISLPCPSAPSSPGLLHRSKWHLFPPWTLSSTPVYPASPRWPQTISWKPFWSGLWPKRRQRQTCEHKAWWRSCRHTWWISNPTHPWTLQTCLSVIPPHLLLLSTWACLTRH